MDLVIVRHAIAEDRERFAQKGLDDAERPLTEKGRRRMAKAARGFARIVEKPAVLATSPYLRAVETAEILRRAYGGLPLTRLSSLVPGARREDVLAWLEQASGNGDGRDEKRVVMIVGHEPALGELAAWLITGETHALFPLRKGGACALRFGGTVEPGGAELQWLLAPSQLRRLG
jgi:phosphohistidine phosphatase